MKYDLKKGYKPGGYTLGEGFMLDAKDNEMTEAQAKPYVEAGILSPQSEPKKSTKKRGK